MSHTILFLLSVLVTIFTPLQVIKIVAPSLYYDNDFPKALKWLLGFAIVLIGVLISLLLWILTGLFYMN